ncbi:MAG: energy transducer TonB [Candidatus Delongbacteria bacterium]|nr:energy transducer TonB [Candidatus Delongbacteria bacterium]
MIIRLFVISFILFLSVRGVHSQEPEVLIFPDEVPSFQDDDSGKKFIDYILQNLDLSNIKAQDSGKIIVNFCVNPDGLISDVIIIKGLNEEIDKAITNVIEGSPTWIPGKIQGKSVKVRLTYPINIDFN